MNFFKFSTIINIMYWKFPHIKENIRNIIWIFPHYI
nr:MAG TPA: hypothetical protein [Caudoviricetes sp.]